MKTNFQPNEVLTAENLNANFTECAGKAPLNHTHAIGDVEGLLGELGSKVDRTNEISILNLNSDNKIVLSNVPNGTIFRTSGVLGMNWSTLFVADDGSAVWPSFHGSGSVQPYILPANDIVYTVFVSFSGSYKQYLISLDAVFGGE